MRKYFLTIEGDGSFPSSLLTWDQCWPKTEVDGDRMPLDLSKDDTKRIITLTSHSPFIIEKWESYGWDIVNHYAS